MHTKHLKQSLKILVLVAAPWFSTGCGLVQALGSMMGGSMPGAPASAATAGSTASTVASVTAPAPQVQNQARPPILFFNAIERVPTRDRT